MGNLSVYITNPTFIVLCLMSVYSIAVMLDQAFYLLKNREDTERLLEIVADESKGREMLVAFSEARPTAHRRLMHEWLRLAGKPAGDVAMLLGEQAKMLRWEAEKRLASLGTIANIAPFIGLFGTVIGVIRAFHAISVKLGAGPSVVAAGISEALISTAAGLFVAVPAVIAYNFFLKRARKLTIELDHMTALLVSRKS